MSTRTGETAHERGGESLRIGDVARLAGTTPRTVRYYEEIGLLPEAAARPSGRHRLYTQADVERLREVLRLKDLLGLSLEELRTVLAAEEARAEVRAQLKREDVVPKRRRELLQEAAGHIDRQLELVRHRAGELAKLQQELCETRKRVRRKIRELDAQAVGAFPPEPKDQAVTAVAGATEPKDHEAVTSVVNAAEPKDEETVTAVTANANANEPTP